MNFTSRFDLNLKKKKKKYDRTMIHPIISSEVKDQFRIDI